MQRTGLQGLRALDVQATVRALAEQRGQRGTGFVDLLLRGLQLLLRGRDAGLGLAHLQIAVDAGFAALAHQLQGLARTLKFLLGHVIGRPRAIQLDVALDDAGGQLQARGLGVDGGGMHRIHRRFPCGTLATPQVEAVTEAGQCLAAAHVAAAHFIAQQRFGQAQAGIAAGHRQARQALGAGHPGLGFSLMQARIGQLQARVPGQAFGHQRIQLRIAEAVPPVTGRESGHGQVIAGQGMRAVQAVGVEQLTLRMQAATAGAGAQGQHQRHRQQRARRARQGEREGRRSHGSIKGSRGSG